MVKKEGKNSATEVREPRPSDYLDYRDYLQGVYDARKQSQSGYSFNRYADDLGLAAASIVHQIVKGRRPLTRRAAEKIGQALTLKGPERQYFLALVDLGAADTSSQRDERQREVLALKARLAPTELARDRLEFLSAWYHPIIRELLGMRGDATPEWLARALRPKIKAEEARKSVELLTRLGLVLLDEERLCYVPTTPSLAISEGTSELPAMRYQSLMIELGKEALGTVDPDRRHVTSTSIRLTQKQIALLHQKIRDFNAEVMAMEAAAAEADDVFHVNIQMFPLTKVRDAEEASDEVA